MRVKEVKWVAVTAAILVGACGSPDTGDQTNAATTVQQPGANASNDGPQGQARQSTAELRTAEGSAAGTATARSVDGGILVALTVEGLPPGQHGVHVHMVGSCGAPSFESAGSHWNPTNRQHGLETPAGQHAGDMPNLLVDEGGRGTLEYRLEGGGFEGLLDDDGSALVVHASADDQRTDPSGNSGGRIACGVFDANMQR